MAILRYSLLLVLILGGAVSAQEEVPYLEGAQKKFEYGLLQFELSHWQEAARHFEDIVHSYPLNHRTTAACVMAARSYLLAGKPTPALRLVEEFQQRFPWSRYLAESALVAGDAAMAAGSRATALLWYVRSWLAERSDHDALRMRIASLKPATIPPGERRFVSELLRNQGPYSSLSAQLQWETPTVRGTAVRVSQDSARGKPSAADGPPRIALALPTHEPQPQRAGIMRDIRDGILSALDIHRKERKFPVMLELLDSRDADSLRRAIERLDSDPRAMVLIAGAFSEDASTVSRLAAEGGMLVLIPTATAEGLTDSGANIFQLNIPMLQRARLLADFSQSELGAHEAIVIAPDHSYARTMAEAFIERCRVLKLPVRLAGWYGIDRGEVSRICRSLDGNRVKNSILFAPVQSRDDIVSVLEGIRGARITLPILGGGNWNHPDLLARLGKDRVIYFESDVLVDTSSATHAALRLAFSARSSRPLSREALFGYDAMQIALSVMSDEHCTRQSVRHAIMNRFEGLRAPVDFLRHRVNSAMNILVSRDGLIGKYEVLHTK